MNTLLSLLLLIFANSQTTIVRAQSTACSAAQSVSAPFSVTPGSVEAVEDSFVFPGYTSCDDASDSGSSVFPAGIWFRYTPSSTTIARVHVEASDELQSSVATVVSTGTCDSLTCVDLSLTAIEDEVLFQADAGVEYLIYAFSDADVSDPFTLFLEEVEPPANDNMESAVALTFEDLPFTGNFTTVGALSDVEQDVCMLGGYHGVWFTFQTAPSQEPLALRATTLNTGEVLGVQSVAGDSSECVAPSSKSTIEWTAEGGVEYYLLVTEPLDSYGGPFELTLLEIPDGSQQTGTNAPTSSVGIPSGETPTTSSEPGQFKGIVFGAGLGLVVALFLDW